MSTTASAEMVADRTKVDAYLDKLTTMQVRHIDAVAGFETALERADVDVAPLLRELKAMHAAFATELADLLEAHGRKPDSDGSWMSYVHETIVAVRDWLTGLDENIIPGLLNGERLLLDMYDDLRSSMPSDGRDAPVVTRQRNRLNQAIDMLNARAT